MNTEQSIVIVGGGHAAAQLCASLQERGLSTGVVLIGAENVLPYQRPPLSKGDLKNPESVPQEIRPRDWYEKAGVRCHLGREVVKLDRQNRIVELDDGSQKTYTKLVLATGTSARRWPMLPAGVTNALTLRTAEDAAALRGQLQKSSNVVVLGGGFIGLEVAATARALGKCVTLLEMAPRLMGRSVSAELAEHVRSTHVANGIDIRLGAAIQAVKVEDGRIVSLTLDEDEVPCDMLLVAIGAEPQIRLAQDAGLACDNGIVVDAEMRTEDPFVFAIGDCVSFPITPDRRLRLESIQNANDQARVVAAKLAGEAATYAPVPWFWSEQGSMRLQMVGLLPKEAKTYRRDGTQPGSFSLFHFDDVRLACVESVNAPMDHMMARKLLEAGISPAPEQVASSDIALKTLLSA